MKKYRPRTKTLTSTKLGIVHGFRSGLEDRNAKKLIRLGEKVTYEEHTLEYSQPAKLRRYTPDFVLANGILIETKGHFISADRQKHLMIKACHPDLDLRFVFSNPHNKISSRSKTTYAKWCDHKGFKWAALEVPDEWINEPPTAKRVAAARKALKWEVS